MLKKIICILLVVLLAFSSVGCSNTDDAYIYFELPQTPGTLDPQVAKEDSELIIIKNIYEGLLRIDSKGEIVCGVAEDYEKNGLTYTFTLRDNAKWSDGEKITANDFVFAFKRAVSPEVNSPFAARLFSISGAEDIYNGKTDIDTLGVKALNDNNLTITLCREDQNFEKTLTSSVAMPCNESFFYSTAGKYGLFADYTLSNGSYRLARWRKDPFGIRLYRNKEYEGDFYSKNAAVFLTCNSEETPIQKLEKNSIDMAFIDSALQSEAEKLNLNVAQFENICWIMTLSNDFSREMRKSLNMLVGSEVYSKSLPVGYTVASSLFPSIFGDNISPIGITAYDSETAKRIYFEEVTKLKDSKFPTDIILYYYDDGYIKDVITDIVGHWQSNLSAFVNIETVSEAAILASQTSEQTYKMCVFPISAESPQVADYLKKFGITYNGESLEQIQTELLKDNNIIPLIFQTTDIAYTKALTNVYTELGNGYIDFSFIIKENI